MIAHEELEWWLDILDICSDLSWYISLILGFPTLPWEIECPRCMDEPLVSTMPEHRLRDKIGLAIGSRRGGEWASWPLGDRLVDATDDRYHISYMCEWASSTQRWYGIIESIEWYLLARFASSDIFQKRNILDDSTSTRNLSTKMICITDEYWYFLDFWLVFCSPDMWLVRSTTVYIEHIPLFSIELHLIEESCTRLGEPECDLEEEDHLFSLEERLTC